MTCNRWYLHNKKQNPVIYPLVFFFQRPWGLFTFHSLPVKYSMIIASVFPLLLVSFVRIGTPFVTVQEARRNQLFIATCGQGLSFCRECTLRNNSFELHQVLESTSNSVKKLVEFLKPLWYLRSPSLKWQVVVVVFSKACGNLKSLSQMSIFYQHLLY